MDFSVIRPTDAGPRKIVLESPDEQEVEGLARELLYSAPLYRWIDLKDNADLPPALPGVYGCFFQPVPPGVPVHSCVVRQGATLLYVGISPDGDRSSGNIRTRLRAHFQGIAESSTLRQTLSCLLAVELGTQLRDDSKTKTFGEQERDPSEWMARNSKVAWVAISKPSLVEDYLFKTVNLPLNLAGNPDNRFGPRLSELRKKNAQGGSLRKRLFLVSCVSDKHDRPMRSRILYRSAWFQKAREYVESQRSPWFILSAKYGLVAPDQVIEPYNDTLNTKGIEERREWSNKVIKELRPHCSPGTSVVILAGKKYREFLLPALQERGCRVEVPMKGLRIGEQLEWLTRQQPSPRATDPILRVLDTRIEGIELQLRSLISSTLNDDPDRLPSHIIQKMNERLNSSVTKSVAIDLEKYKLLRHKIEFCDLRELADSIASKSLWPQFQPRFVNKETFLRKFDQMAELRNGIRHSRTVTDIIRMEGQAGILWFEHVLARAE